jgi:NAD(P)-dependent dehydrogenase (short-subunit alcohol dehydrogenase family)
LQSDYPHRLEVETLDVRDRVAINATVGRVLQRGSVDIVVNNAGYGVIGAAEELTQGQVDGQLDTLLHGPIAITRAFLPALRRQRRGHIIQMSSYGGQAVSPAASMYSAAKWGLEGISESLALEVKSFGIRVTIIEPGAIRTRFARALDFAAPLPDYCDGPVAEFRKFATGAGNETYTGDPVKVASIIADVTRMSDPPLRLALGSEAYIAIDTALHERLRELNRYRAGWAVRLPTSTSVVEQVS